MLISIHQQGEWVLASNYCGINLSCLMATQSIDCAGCRQFEWVGSSFWFLLRNRPHWLQISIWGSFRGERHALKLNCHGWVVYKFIKNHRIVHFKYISTQETEIGWSLWVPGLPGLCRNFQTSQDYTVSLCVNTFPMPGISGLGRDPVSEIQAAQSEDLGLGPQYPCQKLGMVDFLRCGDVLLSWF